jgi:hypothetical protein
MAVRGIAKYRAYRHFSLNEFFMPFTVLMLFVIVGFVGSIVENKATTGHNLVLPQFETAKGMPITPWLHERTADKRFWNAAYSMAGAPVDGIDLQSNHINNGKQRALARLMLKMRHDIEQKGLISEKVESDIIQSFDSK